MGDRQSVRTKLALVENHARAPFTDYLLAGMCYARNGMKGDAERMIRLINETESDEPFFINRQKEFMYLIRGEMYLADGERWLVFATKGGNPKHPDWYHNLVANPAVTIEVGTETIEAHAEVIAGEERDRLYAIQAERYPQFGEYERRTSRIIPVVAISRAGA